MASGLFVIRQLVGKCMSRSIVSGTGSLRSIPSSTASSLVYSVPQSCHFSLAINNRLFSAVPSEEKSNKEGKAAAQETSKESTSPATLQDSYGFQLKTGTPDRMPSSFEQATGSERAELEDPDLYRNPEKYVNSRVMIAPFGTKEKPLLIPSRYDARMIGCTGREAPNDHEVYYMTVKENNDKVCPLCGQVFRLKKVAGGESSHHHE
ncbi:hypothetical protein GpartN1_g4803.t1 [Galdieria partita]|uniref:Cytochrome c oxidase subunit Vb n=1 Tax=Galdieria partita TaxID=83374 RepID=A0A9C7UP12_9RHOD|nr:hypothetical protein GpartN1_g1836.t1 [Galdieria partita]GJQ13012.1 hypothetical protein GpartN1_g4803.t1 [Galdieria partita]